MIQQRVSRLLARSSLYYGEQEKAEVEKASVTVTRPSTNHEPQALGILVFESYEERNPFASQSKQSAYEGDCRWRRFYSVCYPGTD